MPHPATDLDHTPDDGSEPADDLDDLDSDDYATAAERLADEATRAQDDTTDVDDAEEPDGSPRDQRARARAIAAEAQRDRLMGIVDGMRRTEVERLAAPRLADPADVFRDGATLADVLDADGRVDAAKLDSVIDTVIGAHPHWRAPVVPYSGTLYSGASNMKRVDAPTPGFRDAFAPKSE